MDDYNFDAMNDRIFGLLAEFLSYEPNFVKPEQVKKLVETYGIDEKKAVAFSMAAAMGLDIADNKADKALFNEYFPLMLKKLDASVYLEDAYRKNIPLHPHKNQNWELNMGKYAPYEAFVRDEPLLFPNGKVVPQIGYFDHEYLFPQILQDGREWMMIQPDEVDTQKPYIERAHGKVLTFGLGLGYFAYHCLISEKVSEVTVVELDEKVIDLFNEQIRPHFPKDKPFRVIQADAFEYASTQMGKENFDYIFTDIWHDPSDGVDLYLRMKEHEKYAPKAEFTYWIEKTLKLYI